MHRRDVLKALATLPFATALVGCEGEKNKEDKEHKERLNILEVHLDGAFAVVIQENKANSILAFSPRPPKGDEPHQFYFNGYPEREAQKAYNFKLAAETRDRDSKIEISPGLNDFSFRTERWRVGDSLLSLELPAPNRITFSGHRSPVKFLSSQKSAFMPPTTFWNMTSKRPSCRNLSVVSQVCNASPPTIPFPA